MAIWLAPANTRRAPGWSADVDTGGGAAHCSALVRGIDTPAAAHAAWVSPEQSKPWLHGPVPPNTYGQPSWFCANWTAAPAPWPLTGGGLWPTGTLGVPGVGVPGPVPTRCAGVSCASSACCWEMVFCSVFFWLVSLAFSAAFASLVRRAACCAPVSWRAAETNCFIWLLLDDDSSCRIEAWSRIFWALPEVSSTAGDVRLPFS